MGGEWPIRKLADLCNSVDYGYTASANDTPIGPKFLRITDIVSGEINWDTVPYCEIDKSTRLKFLLHHDDVVIARTGATTGYSAYIANPPDAVFASYLVRLKIGPEADSRFVSYFLKSNQFWVYMRGVLGDKSAQPNASAKTMTQVTLPVPPLKEQQAIAHILGTLDDKIELNRQMNKTLEEMARAIFKSWFVDFLPVRAKMAARTQAGGLKPEIAKLFPDSFENSELGEIPKGWKVSTVGQSFRLTMGQSPPGSTYNENGEGIPFYQGRSDFGYRFPSRRVFCTAPTRFAEAGDTLVSVRAPVGDVNIANELCAVGRGVAAILHRNGYKSFTYYSMKYLKDYFDKFEAEGTVFGSINKSDFEKLPLIAPFSGVLELFDRIVSAIDCRIKTNSYESNNLAAMRDALLPKLISGELRIKDAERFLKEKTI
jgi:type I restriction enzyme S subunit